MPHRRGTDQASRGLTVIKVGRLPGFLQNSSDGTEASKEDKSVRTWYLIPSPPPKAPQIHHKFKNRLLHCHFILHFPFWATKEFAQFESRSSGQFSCHSVLLIGWLLEWLCSWLIYRTDLTVTDKPGVSWARFAIQFVNWDRDAFPWPPVFSRYQHITNCQDLMSCGIEPVSEPETKTVCSIIGSKEKDILWFLTMHSYGRLTLTPYGYTKNKPSNYEELVSPKCQGLSRQTSTGLLPSFPRFSFPRAFGSIHHHPHHPYFLFLAFHTLPDACWEDSGLNAALPMLINYLFREVSSWETS